MNTHPPKLLPWLARKAGITLSRAETLWHAAQRHAALRTGEADQSAFWKAAMDRLHELIAADALREDAASFGWRRWARWNDRAWREPVAIFEALSLGYARQWQLFDNLMAPLKASFVR